MTEDRNLLEKASISLLLDSYDAIFSDFDPRPFTERAISEDFLAEAKKTILENREGNLELGFLIPKNLHNIHTDNVIRERLHHYFKKETQSLENQIKGLITSGILIVIMGMGILFFTSLIINVEKMTFWRELLKVAFEPGGWFAIWFGLDRIFYFVRQKNSELAYYRKMIKAEISFKVYQKDSSTEKIG